MKTKFKAYAYLPSYYSLSNVMDGKQLPIISQDEDHSFYTKEGYPQIGACTVTVEFHSQDAIVAKQIEALNAELENHRAESQVKENAILLKISKLQALTCEAQPA